MIKSEVIVMIPPSLLTIHLRIHGGGGGIDFGFHAMRKCFPLFCNFHRLKGSGSGGHIEVLVR